MTERERITKLVYEAIARWQNGVMPDLESYEEAAANPENASGAFDIARETTNAILNGSRP